MRFLVNGEFIGKSRLLQIILYSSLLYLAVLWVTGLLLYVDKLGFTYDAVAGYYLGSEEKFTNPVSYRGLLEVTHFHFFAYGMILLLLNHLATAANIPGSLKLFFILLSSASGVANISVGWLVRYVSPFFAYLKIGSFVTFQLSFLTLLVFSFFAVGMYRSGKGDGGQK
jgi:hypothetical protein